MRDSEASLPSTKRQQRGRERQGKQQQQPGARQQPEQGTAASFGGRPRSLLEVRIVDRLEFLSESDPSVPLNCLRVLGPQERIRVQNLQPLNLAFRSSGSEAERLEESV